MVWFQQEVNQAAAKPLPLSETQYFDFPGDCKGVLEGEVENAVICNILYHNE